MLDTNVILDWLLQRDPERTRRVDNMIANSSELHVSDVTIIELAYALEKFYKLPRDIVAANVDVVISHDKLNTSNVIFRKVIAHYTDHPSLSFVDCYLINYSRVKHITPVWTFDKKLANQSNKLAKLVPNKN